ncbi:cytochrome c [Alcaligenaceae bacterium]|nr:cytochrome c [Alcaligenaceae bacterium]
MKYLKWPTLVGGLLLCLGGASFAAGPDAEQLEIGKALFKSGAVPACAICHTMEDAEASGTIGPDLDELKPDFEQVKKMMKEGAGAMPSFAATLDDKAMDAIAAYVVHATSGK